MTTARSRHWVALIALPLASCTLIDRPLDNSGLNKLLDDYAKRTAVSGTAHATIDDVRVQGASTTATVTVDLDRAPLRDVVLRILDAAHLPYLLNNVSLRGTVTARF